MKKQKLIWSFLALLGAVGLLTLLNSRITLYSDDYWYGTFLRGGADAFWQEMKSHYLTTNGRFYIHLIVPAVLYFGTGLFTMLSPLLLALLFWWGHRFLNRSLSLPATLCATALGMLAVMAADPRYLRMTLLWISAYFNYIFPLALILGAACFQQKCPENRSVPALLGGLLLALLAGASTEQCGIVALAVLGGQALFQRRSLRSWLYPLAALAGFMTVLLAPGSWARVDRGVEGGILSCLQPRVFFARFFDAMGYVVRYPSTVLLLAALFALAGLVALADRRLCKGLWGGFPLAAGQLLFFALGWEKVACLWAVAGIALLTLLFFLQKDYRPTGLVLLGALAAHMMLIVTGMNSERTVFCGIVALMLAAVSLMMRLTGRLRLPVAAVTAAVCLVCWGSTFAGYRTAYRTVQKNLRSIQQMEENGVVYFDLDIDPRYRYTMPCDGNAFYVNYRNYYRIPAEIPLVFTSENWELLPIEGSVFPALEREGALYLPVDYALQAAGGQAVWSWSGHFYTLTHNGNTYHANKEGQLWQIQPDGTRQLLAEDLILFSPHLDHDTLLYGSAAQLKQYLGIRFENGKIQ